MTNKHRLLKWLSLIATVVIFSGCAVNSTISLNKHNVLNKEKAEIKSDEVVKTLPAIKHPEETPSVYKKEEKDKTKIQDKINKIFVGCRKFQKPEIPPEIIIEYSEIKDFNDKEIIKKLLDHIKKTRQQYLLILRKYNESMIDHLKSCKN